MAAEFPGRERHALSVVSRRGGDDARASLRRREIHHLVVGAPQLKGKDGLKVLSLEKNVRRQTKRERLGPLQRRFDGHVVDARLADFVDIGIEYQNILLFPAKSVDRI